jgi:hypothetical protein
MVPGSDPGTPAPLSIDTFRNGPSTGMEAYVNGQLQASTSSGAYAALSGSSLALGSVGRGLRVNLSDERFNGDIAEVLVFDSDLAESDRQAAETYLEAHWGGVAPLTTGGGCN